MIVTRRPIDEQLPWIGCFSLACGSSVLDLSCPRLSHRYHSLNRPDIPAQKPVHRATGWTADNRNWHFYGCS